MSDSIATTESSLETVAQEKRQRQQDTIVSLTTGQQNMQLSTLSSSLEKIVSACTGAVITMSFMNPLDVVKTRLQEATKGSSSMTEYKGTIDAMGKIFKSEGIFALWRGLIPGLIMALPSTAIYFVGYDYIRDHTRDRFANTVFDTYSPLWAGGLARTMAALVVSPLELFRTRMQSIDGMNGFSGVWDGVKRMVQAEGPQALWRGLLPTMLRDVPFSAVYWMGYEDIKQRLERHNGQYQLSKFQTSFIAGASSGMFAAVVTTPFDVVKTQRQVSSDAREARLNHILKNIWQKDGFHGYFRGVVPRVAKVAPACAIMISSYEMGKHFFANRRLNNSRP